MNTPIEQPRRDHGIDEATALKIALYYTKGDVESANNMVAGSYNDLQVFKIKFTSPMINGACLLFFNRIYNQLADCYGIISPTYSVGDISTHKDWKEFEREISEYFNTCEHDKGQVFSFLEAVRNGVTATFAKDLQYFVEMQDLPGMASIFKRQVFSGIELGNIKLDVHFETISSLDMERYSKSSIKLTPEQISGAQPPAADGSMADDAPIVIEKDDEDTFDKNKIKLIFHGALVLDPINGMNVAGLVVKDSIKIRLVDENRKAVLIAKAFNAYADGQMMPIVGSIVSYRKKATGGYKIFVEIADGIYVRIEEDERNIKVAFVAPSPDRPPELQKGIEKYVDKYIEQQRKKEPVNDDDGNAADAAEGADEGNIYTQLAAFAVILLCIIGVIVFIVMKK